jgi:hypothetical protein
MTETRTPHAATISRFVKATGCPKATPYKPFGRDREGYEVSATTSLLDRHVMVTFTNRVTGSEWATKVEAALIERGYKVERYGDWEHRSHPSRTLRVLDPMSERGYVRPRVYPQKGYVAKAFDGREDRIFERVADAEEWVAAGEIGEAVYR